jgi:DNA-binding NarL/FixJ family response regulator
MKTRTSHHILTIPEISWKKNMDFLFTGASEEFAKFVGYPKVSTLVGTTDYELRCPAVEGAPEFRKTDEQVVLSQKDLKVINIHDLATGGLFAFLTKKSPSYDKNGRLVGVSGRCINITELLSNVSQLIFDEALPCQKLKKGTYTIGYDSADIKLSSRQQECLFFLLRGKTAKQIGQQLNLGHRTIESYLETIKSKFNCQTRYELIDRATEMGFLNSVPAHLLYQYLVPQTRHRK